jgi:predicted TIM-barrel fold metal-dependent hydrolase
VEYGTDTTRAIAQLVFGGEAQRNPDIRMIFSHGGGVMPYLYSRFESHAETPAAAPNAMAELKRFFYDTASIAAPPPLAALRRVVPLSQILFGSDYPWGSAGRIAEDLRASRVFDEREISAIEHGNAKLLLSRSSSFASRALRRPDD